MVNNNTTKPINWCTVAKVTSVLFGGYILLNVLMSFRLGAISIWELRGYIDGIVRASGDASTSVSNLTYWKDYWLGESPEMEFLINALYNYGLQQTSLIYE